MKSIKNKISLYVEPGTYTGFFNHEIIYDQIYYPIKNRIGSVLWEHIWLDLGNKLGEDND